MVHDHSLGLATFYIGWQLILPSIFDIMAFCNVIDSL